MIELSYIYKRYHQSYVIKDVSLTIRKGETFVFLGSSGSGKTTLLKMMNRLITPTQGDILINGHPIQHYKKVTLCRSMGYVFQKVGLFPHMNIENNISIVLQLMGKPLQERLKRSHELLERVGLDPTVYATRYPNELSGGQCQRIGVARALATDPSILLMDEPFGALDVITRHELQDMILKLHQQMNKTIVFVTHDIAEAFRLADRIAIMHQGRLEQIGHQTDIIKRPKTPFVKQLLETIEQAKG